MTKDQIAAFAAIAAEHRRRAKEHKRLNEDPRRTEMLAVAAYNLGAGVESAVLEVAEQFNIEIDREEFIKACNAE